MDIIKKLNKSDNLYETINCLSIDELEKIIEYAANKYYNTAHPVMTDNIYDMLIDFLKSKNPKSKILKVVGSPLKTNKKTKLDYWLGSMDKIKPDTNNLSLWLKKYTNNKYNLSDKLDGISALLIYNDDEIKMYTRGTAEEGSCISHLIKYLSNIPSYETINKWCNVNNIRGNKNLIAFRGELIMKDEIFKKNWSDKLKNSRNTIAGLVNSKTININIAKDTDLVIYEMVDPFYPIEKQFKILNKLGFNVVYNKTINNLSYDILSKELIERKNKTVYTVDGIIITDAYNDKRNTDGNPDYAFAFKDISEDQKAMTIVLNIEWAASKNGNIKPVLILKPVTIGGVEIRRTTGFNAKYIIDNKLGKGAVIEIIRSGDVIPKVNKVLKIAVSGVGELPDMNYKWSSSGVDIIIDDMKTNKNVLIKNLYFFFSSLEVKGLGEKTIEKLVNANINSVSKILKLTVNDLLMVDGFQEKSASNLIDTLHETFSSIKLYKLMASSNKLGIGIGETLVKSVLDKYPNVLIDYKNWSKSEFINNLNNIDGFGIKTSTLFVSNFDDFIKFYDSIKDYVTLVQVNKKNNKFLNKTFVFSSFRDADLKRHIEENGGKVSESISKNINYLVIKDDNALDKKTEKMKKAEELGIVIIIKNDLNKLF